MHDEQQTFYSLGVALALGLLIGVERSRKSREEAGAARRRCAHTYGLIGLLSAIAGLSAIRLLNW
jgi:uncharacterized membrane protein YhiD involved in acid resistance